MARLSTRREFLTGSAAADALADAANRAVGGEAATAPGARKSYLLHVERQAMACRFAVYLNPTAAGADVEAAVQALALVAELEEQLSVFKEQSEISRINRLAAEEEVEVETRLMALLMRAAELHRQTHGAFDITAGPLTKAWGFFRRQGKLPQPEEIARALETVGSQYLELDAERSTIRFQRRGVEINLGAIGKGYALDRASELLASEGVGDFLLHGGQSSVLARGRQASSGESVRGWTIGVKHPVWPKQRLAEIDLVNRALGTSGAETQYFFHQGKRYGHVIDPRSGWPASGVLSASVLAPDAASADALSTAFYVLGLEGARQYCESHAEVAAVLVTPGEKSGAVTLHTFGLAENEIRFSEAAS